MEATVTLPAIETPAADGAPSQVQPSVTAYLGAMQQGYRGRISRINAQDVLCAYTPAELERRLLEMGFVEGSAVEVLHQGAFRGDPIAVRVGHCTVALRRREAMAILVE